MLERARRVGWPLLAVTIFASCADWQALYGKYCDDALVASESDCVIQECGNGNLEPGEECDDANADDTDGCLSSCVLARCGDGVLFAASEDCDDGNQEDADGCSARCRKETSCGDGEISGNEDCDDGGREPGDGCSEECALEPDPVTCGNGLLDENEVCDDGNLNSDDTCLPGCTWSTCGDGVVRDGVESCDDGNADNGDGCTRSCLVCGEPGTRHRIGNDHCYVLHTKKLGFDEAQELCAGDGGYLWTGTSSGEVNEIQRRLIQDAGELWIGLKKQGTERVWLTGETSTYAPWLEDQPSGQACTTQSQTDTADANFMARACGYARGFVCEFEPALIDPVSHHAYRRYFARKKFADAGAACKSYGGALVSLETATEADFVMRQFLGEVWVGASRALSGDFDWLSGSPVSEEVLDGADTSGTEGCLTAGGREFAPAACEDEMPFVCEFR